MKSFIQSKTWKILGLTQIIIVYIICLMPMKSHGPPTIPHLDKLVHFSIYLVLGAWFSLCSKQKNKKYLFIFFVCMGTSIEFLQELTETRSFDLLDIAANTLGALIGNFFLFKK